MATPGEVLDDLDSFLDRLSEEEYDEEEEKEEEVRIYSGDACHECRVCKNPATAALLVGHRGCMKEILRANDVEKLAAVRSENGSTLAHIAARKNDMETLNLLVSNITSLVTVGDIRGATPLHVCAYRGQDDGLLSLLDAGAQADQPDLDGATAVHFAAVSGHLDSLKLLLQRGRGNANARSNSGETPGSSSKLHHVRVYIAFFLQCISLLKRVTWPAFTGWWSTQRQTHNWHQQTA